MSFCKYRDARATYCPHGCTQDVVVCHKWSRGDCRYQRATHCRFGIHGEPKKRQHPEARGTADAPSAPKKPRISTDDIEKSPHPEASGTADDPTEVAYQAMKQLLMKETRPATTLRRLLLAMHPDKVKDTQFEPLFTKITQTIIEQRLLQAPEILGSFPTQHAPPE